MEIVFDLIALNLTFSLCVYIQSRLDRINLMYGGTECSIFLFFFPFASDHRMSANVSQNLWKEMLSDFQQREAFWLKQIHKRTDVADDKFL